MLAKYIGEDYTFTYRKHKRENRPVRCNECFYRDNVEEDTFTVEKDKEYNIEIELDEASCFIVNGQLVPHADSRFNLYFDNGVWLPYTIETLPRFWQILSAN